MAKVSRRCGCRDEQGKQYGAKCPKRKNYRHGTWGFRLSAGVDETGKRRYVTDFSYPTAEDAENALGKVQRQLKRKAYSFERTTVKDYLEGWVEARERRGELKASTVRMYRSYIRNDIVPALGSLELRKVARADVSGFIEDMRDEGRGATTIRRIHATLSSAFADAVSNGQMPDNPCNSVTLPKVSKSRVNVWGQDEATKFLEAAQGHRLGTLFEVAILTGMRRGELCGLRWQDVDLVDRTITVNTQLVQVGKSVVENSAKTEAGARVVALSDRLVGALMEWKIRQDGEREEWAEAYEDSGRVFTYENGTQLRPGYPSSALKTLLAKHDLPPLKFHGLRHQFASILLESDVPLALVSKMMGHSTTAITSDLYGHMVKGTAHRVADAASAWFEPRVQDSPAS
ncbi:tyrosine-type recombinase/integrase [Brevibacterium aurantiacum]|uniref:tyrosine-type recombinase/integrase n=1 Tax=Brevibacterium aurantiacum TaxID=273384 RepID=UPI003F8E38B4